MERAFKVGCRVVVFDSLRVAHEGLVTNWFHGGPDGQTLAELQAKHDERMATISPENRGPIYMPCCNVVFVSEDKNKTDPYGWQLERFTSLAYGRQQHVPFTGQCWCWPDEADEAREMAAKAYAEATTRK